MGNKSEKLTQSESNNIPNHNWKLNLIMIGEKKCGKSNLMKSFNEQKNFSFDESYQPTIANYRLGGTLHIEKYNLLIDVFNFFFFVEIILKKHKNFCIKVNEISGDPKYESLISLFTSQCFGAIICFDSSDPELSFEMIEKKLEKLSTQKDILISFNKSDLITNENDNQREKIEKIKLEMFEKYPQIEIVETSSKNFQNVNLIFVKMAIKLMLKYQKIDFSYLVCPKWKPNDKQIMNYWKKDLQFILLFFLSVRKRKDTIFFNFPKPIIFEIVIHVSDSLLCARKTPQYRCTPYQYSRKFLDLNLILSNLVN